MRKFAQVYRVQGTLGHVLREYKKILSIPICEKRNILGLKTTIMLKNYQRDRRVVWTILLAVSDRNNIKMVRRCCSKLVFEFLGDFRGLNGVRIPVLGGQMVDILTKFSTFLTILVTQNRHLDPVLIPKIPPKLKH